MRRENIVVNKYFVIFWYVILRFPIVLFYNARLLSTAKSSLMEQIQRAATMAHWLLMVELGLGAVPGHALCPASCVEEVRGA